MGGEAQMWDRAPGPLRAESETEEGSEEEGSERQGAAAARTSQVRLCFRPGQEQDLADLIFHVSFSFPQLQKRTPRPSPTLLFTLSP